MKHTPALLLSMSAALVMTSCVVPGDVGYGSGYSSASIGYRQYNTLPAGYSGDAYFYGGAIIRADVTRAEISPIKAAPTATDTFTTDGTITVAAIGTMAAAPVHRFGPQAMIATTTMTTAVAGAIAGIVTMAGGVTMTVAATMTVVATMTAGVAIAGVVTTTEIMTHGTAPV